MESFSKETRESLGKIDRKLTDLRNDPEFKVSGDGEKDVCDLVLSGGGAKGVAQLGALWALDQLGIKIKRLSGTSAALSIHHL
jgi:predicted acylesterase/phospholipase RssA